MGFLQVMWKKKDTEAAGGIMYIIAGLGNPDKKYVNTRHNVRVDVIDALAEQIGRASCRERVFITV